MAIIYYSAVHYTGEGCCYNVKGVVIDFSALGLKPAALNLWSMARPTAVQHR
jgi:hypothetical protein